VKGHPIEIVKTSRIELALIALLTAFALTFFDDMHRAIGWAGILVSALCLTLAAIVLTAIWLFSLPPPVSKPGVFLSFFILLLMTRIFAGFFFNSADQIFHYRQIIAKSQIEHFCYYKFDRNDYVAVTRACPACMDQLERVNRNVISIHFKTGRTPASVGEF